MKKYKVFIFLWAGGLSAGMLGWFAHPWTPLLIFQTVALTGLGLMHLYGTTKP